MANEFGKRPREAVQELEAMQQQERIGAGEPVLSTEDFARLLRDDIRRELVTAQLKEGGVEAAIEAAENVEAAVENKFKARMDAWHVDDESQWSRYEALGVRWGIANICTRIESAFARHTWSIEALPVVGTLTTGQVTARTQRSSAGVPMILIDNGFFKFSGMMSQLAVFARYDATVRGGFTEATLKLAADLAATQTVLNTCLYAYPRSTPPEFRTTVENLQDAISVFVLSHEYAHLLAGDLDAHPAMPPKQDMTLQAREFEADKIGFAIVLECARDAEAGVFGPFLFFAGLDLLARAGGAYQGQTAGTESSSVDEYPTPFERTRNLLGWIETMSYEPRFVGHVRAASACYNIILNVWDQILAPFGAAREQLSQFDPALHPGPYHPDAAAFGVVTVLWQHIVAHLGQA